MVSITTYVKDDIRAILFTEIKGREVNGEWAIKKEKGDSVILKELKAVRLGLSHIIRPVDLEIYVGNQWVVTALNSWINTWQQNGWKKTNGKEVENRELLEEIAAELKKHKYVVKNKEEKA